MNGIIVKIISNQYTVKTAKESYVCTARGKFRLAKNSPVVGDKVVIDTQTKQITDILPRSNKLNRPPVANIDYALIVTSLKEPNLSLHLLDKNLTVVTHNKVTPIILLTKLDLCKETEQKRIAKIKKYYEQIGYHVFYNTELGSLKKLLKNKVVTLIGQSGAGKSSFLNKLNPELNLKTSPISQALNRGVHTTRHVEIYDIEGILVMDTPGFSALNLNMSVEEMQETFPEFKKYVCKYQDCKHYLEKACMIKDKVKEGKILKSRYTNYVSFIEEIYANSRKLHK